MDVDPKYLDFFGKLAWPLTAGILLFLFYSPVYSFVERMSAMDAQRVSVGSFDVQFSGKEVAQLPQLDDELAVKLAGLTADERETLLSVSELSPLSGACTVDGFETAIRTESLEAVDFISSRIDELETRRKLLGSLESLEFQNLLRSNRAAIREGDFFCSGTQGRTFRLTKEGTTIRRYYLDLTAKTIGFTTGTIEEK